MNTTQTLTRDDLLTDCERSMRYHQARRRFFNSTHLGIQFLIFAFASVGVSNFIVNLSSDSHTWMLAIISLLALASLVYRPAGKATLHASLYRSFTDLAGTIAATPDASESDRAEWTRRIHLLYGDEPPVYRALLAHCDNQVAIALNAVDKGYFVDLHWHHRLLRNFIPFQGTDFRNRNQINAAAC